MLQAARHEQRKRKIHSNSCKQFTRKSNRSENFSYEGLEALYNYLEQYEEDTGEEIELDIIALCCEFSEYESLEAFQNDYGDEYKSINDIEYRTTVIPINKKAFIIQNF